jgi:hypothetical protein
VKMEVEIMNKKRESKFKGMTKKGRNWKEVI